MMKKQTHIYYMNTYWNLLKEYYVLHLIAKKRIIISLLVLFALSFFVWKLLPDKIGGESSTPYVIARDATWYPLQLLGKEKNMLAMSNDLLFNIAKQEHIHIELLSVPAGPLFHGLESGQYDGILTALRPTVENERYYYFSQPFFSFSPVLILNKNTSITISQMTGKTLGILSGTNFAFLYADDFSDLQVHYYDNPTHAITDLARGVIDGIVLDLFTAYAYASGPYVESLYMVAPPLSSEGLRLVTLKSERTKRLIDSFNTGLKRIKEEGTYKSLLSKWELPNLAELPVMQK
jgi:polar amino acid transport system substrate-binding protein